MSEDECTFTSHIDSECVRVFLFDEIKVTSFSEKPKTPKKELTRYSFSFECIGDTVCLCVREEENVHEWQSAAGERTRVSGADAVISGPMIEYI